MTNKRKKELREEVLSDLANVVDSIACRVENNSDEELQYVIKTAEKYAGSMEQRASRDLRKMESN